MAGLTTALELKDRYPNSKLTIVAKFLPGDRSIEYTSPWAGANWVSVVHPSHPLPPKSFKSPNQDPTNTPSGNRQRPTRRMGRHHLPQIRQDCGEVPGIRDSENGFEIFLRE